MIRAKLTKFPISRDPPEGGTPRQSVAQMTKEEAKFPISRDPPEGGTDDRGCRVDKRGCRCFQFLGIPPKGERPASSLR